MFSAFKRALPEISIFHHPASPPSIKALALLRNSLSSPYPQDQKSAPPLYFNLEVVESAPTPDQLRTILSFLPRSSSPVFLSAHPSSSSVGQPNDVSEIHRLAMQNPNIFKWPVVVAWSAGLASVGDVDGVKAILEALRKKRDGEVKDEEDYEPKGWFS